MTSLLAYFHKPLSRRLILLGDVFLVVVSVLGVYATSQKPQLPFAYSDISDAIRSTETYHMPDNSWHIPKGIAIEAFDGAAITQNEELEYLLDGKRAGDKATITVANETHEVTLVPYYDLFYLVVQSVVGAIFFFFGVFVFVKRPEDEAARVAHLLSVSTALIIFMTWSSYASLGVAGNWIRLIWYAASLSVAALLIHFGLVFPRKRMARVRWVVVPVNVVCTGIFVWNALTSFVATQSGSKHTGQTEAGLTLRYYHQHLPSLQASRVLFMVAAAVTAVLFSYSYVTTQSFSEKQRLKWVLFGISAGVFSYVIFWQLPQIFNYPPLMPEAAVIIFTALAPVTFAISIVKYRLLDIDFILNRSAVYTMVVGFLVLIYETIITLVGTIVSTQVMQDTLRLIPSLSGAMVGLLFSPVKMRMQHFVDRRLFKQNYVLKDALQQLVLKLEEQVESASLARVMVKEIDELLGPHRIAFIQLTSAPTEEGPEMGTPGPLLGAHFGFDDLIDDHTWAGFSGVVIELTQLTKGHVGSMVKSHAIEPDVRDLINLTHHLPHDINKRIHTEHVAILLPLRSAANRDLGTLVLGTKIRNHYNTQDIALLREACYVAGLQLERILRWEHRLLSELHRRHLASAGGPLVPIVEPNLAH